MGWILLGVALGLALGFALAYLIQERRLRGGLASAQTDRALAVQQVEQLRAQLQAVSDELKACRGDLATAREERAAALAQREAARQQLEQQKQSVAEALDQMRETFASLCQDALKNNNETFLSLASTRFEQLSTLAAGTLDERKAQIETLLKPLQETLGTYQQRLQQIEQSRQDGYGKLLEQLGTVGEIGRNLERQTTQLVTALRRPSTRGQWGEITLRRLVELAGMSAHCDFSEQHTVYDADDQMQRPDLVVHLPGGRTIVIDSKVALDKFLDAAACGDEAQRNLHLNGHASHIRARARELSQKSYWTQFERSPEFVVMFLPGESFLYAAVERDPTLIEDTIKDRVIIATPTTLIALLKAVEHGWRQEAVSQNAEEIRRLGVELYDRLAIVAGHLGAVGERLRRSVDAYNSLVGSFDSRVMVTARRFGDLGARGTQDLTDPQPVDVQPRILATEVELPEPRLALAPSEVDARKAETA